MKNISKQIKSIGISELQTKASLFITKTLQREQSTLGNKTALSLAAITPAF
jgi:hypothetical protein